MTTKLRLGEILISAGLIDEFQLRSALAEQQRWGDRLGITLVKLGFLDEDELLKVLSRHLNVPVVRLEGKRIEAEVISLVPAELAEKYCCLPLFVKPEKTGKLLFLGMDDPTNLDVLDDLGFRTGMKLRPVLVAPAALKAAIDRYYRGGPGAFVGDSGSNQDRPTFEEPEPVAATPPATSVPVDDLEPETETEPEPEPAVDGKQGEPSTRMILRALTQLLIEKGVFERNELVEKIRQIQKSGKS